MNKSLSGNTTEKSLNGLYNSSFDSITTKTIDNITDLQLSYLNTLTSNVQTQINNISAGVGATPNLTIGTVTSSSTIAAATITGTPTDPILNLTLKTGANGSNGSNGSDGSKGDKGNTGDTGPSGDSSGASAAAAAAVSAGVASGSAIAAAASALSADGAAATSASSAAASASEALAAEDSATLAASYARHFIASDLPPIETCNGVLRVKDTYGISDVHNLDQTGNYSNSGNITTNNIQCQGILPSGVILNIGNSSTLQINLTGYSVLVNGVPINNIYTNPYNPFNQLGF